MAGTRGAASKESFGDLVLACLGNKELSGSVTNTRLAVRKHRGGRQGQEYPFVLREVAAPEPDEDGEPITTMVVDWTGPVPETQSGPDDPWAKPERQDQRTAALRLKRVLMTILAERGVDLPIAPNGPVVRMVDQKLVRKAFYNARRRRAPRSRRLNFAVNGSIEPSIGPRISSSLRSQRLTASRTCGSAALSLKVMSRRMADRDTSPGHFASPYRGRSVPPKCPAPEVPIIACTGVGWCTPIFLEFFYLKHIFGRWGEVFSFVAVLDRETGGVEVKIVCYY